MNQLFMVATAMPKISLPNLTTLRKDYPQFTFAESEVFRWSPQEKTVYYNKKEVEKKEGLFQLLHELGHALLGHTRFLSGVQLVKFEAMAWQEAQRIAEKYKSTIPDGLIDQYLNTYRDWLFARSLCPTCNATSMEVEENYYRCFNCSQKWKVPDNQQARCYRLRFGPSS